MGEGDESTINIIPLGIIENYFGIDDTFIHDNFILIETNSAIISRVRTNDARTEIFVEDSVDGGQTFVNQTTLANTGNVISKFGFGMWFDRDNTEIWIAYREESNNQVERGIKVHRFNRSGSSWVDSGVSARLLDDDNSWSNLTVCYENNIQEAYIAMTNLAQTEYKVMSVNRTTGAVTERKSITTNNDLQRFKWFVSDDNADNEIALLVHTPLVGYGYHVVDPSDGSVVDIVQTSICKDGCPLTNVEVASREDGAYVFISDRNGIFVHTFDLASKLFTDSIEIARFNGEIAVAFSDEEYILMYDFRGDSSFIIRNSGPAWLNTVFVKD